MRVAYKKKTGYSISDKVDGDVTARIASLKASRAALEAEQKDILVAAIENGDRLVDPLVVPNF
jgi:hypothetical protein